jgi:hypothetical protein
VPGSADPGHGTVPIAVRTFTTAIAVCGLLAACKPPASQPDAAEADAPAIDAPVHRGIDLGVTWTPIGYVQATQGDLTAFYQGHAAYGTTIAVHRPWRASRATAGQADVCPFHRWRSGFSCSMATLQPHRPRIVLQEIEVRRRCHVHGAGRSLARKKTLASSVRSVRRIVPR